MSIHTTNFPHHGCPIHISSFNLTNMVPLSATRRPPNSTNDFMHTLDCYLGHAKSTRVTGLPSLLKGKKREKILWGTILKRQILLTAVIKI